MLEKLWADGHSDTIGGNVDGDDQEGQLGKNITVPPLLGIYLMNLHTGKMIRWKAIHSAWPSEHLSTGNQLNACSQAQLRNTMQLWKRTRKPLMFWCWMSSKAERRKESKVQNSAELAPICEEGYICICLCMHKTPLKGCAPDINRLSIWNVPFCTFYFYLFLKNLFLYLAMQGLRRGMQDF